MTYEFYDMFLYAESIPKERMAMKLEFIKKIFQLLPETNYKFMKLLIYLLWQVKFPLNFFLSSLKIKKFIKIFQYNIFLKFLI